MDIRIERMVTILGFMYGRNSEVVFDVSNDKYRLFVDVRNQFELTEKEFNCLLYNDIIEHMGGCGEKGHVTEVYNLTETAQKKIRLIIRDKRTELLELALSNQEDEKHSN
ncbi:MAG TPA: hypothetical protein VK153_00520 [Candidatus Paceibacterota bacterium]|nr:hypothetical protein [Candidatus Paceibacterota bacterium]